MASWLYEGILLFGVAFVAGYTLDTLSQSRHALQNRELRLVFLFVVFGIYFVWFWAKGQTLAMKTWHIRVVDRQGLALTQQRALLRYCLSWVWFLPPLAGSALAHASKAEAAVLVVGWVVFWALLSRLHPKTQFWHDTWAGTQLVTALPVAR
jgi:uncharacterized RDD family membrane protein YckC